MLARHLQTMLTIDRSFFVVRGSETSFFLCVAKDRKTSTRNQFFILTSFLLESCYPPITP